MSLMEDPQESIKKLAQGKLRDQPIEAWNLIESAWSLLQRFILNQFVTKKFPKYLMEDCGQIVMERVWKYRRTYRGNSEGAFWGWLRSICDNEQKRFLRKEAKNPASLTEVVGRTGGNEGDIENHLSSTNPYVFNGSPTVDHVMDIETRLALKSCLSRLSEKHGMVIELIYGLSGLTEKAVAEELGNSPSYVHKLKEQALELLRRCLEHKGVQ